MTVTGIFLDLGHSSLKPKTDNKLVLRLFL